MLLILQTKRHDKRFEKPLDDLMQEKEKYQVIEEANLSRRKQMSLRYDTPNHHYYNDPELFYRQHYYIILDFAVESIQERSNQPYYQTHFDLQNLIV